MQSTNTNGGFSVTQGDYESFTIDRSNRPASSVLMGNLSVGGGPKKKKLITASFQT